MLSDSDSIYKMLVETKIRSASTKTPTSLATFFNSNMEIVFWCAGSGFELAVSNQIYFLLSWFKIFWEAERPKLMSSLKSFLKAGPSVLAPCKGKVEIFLNIDDNLPSNFELFGWDQNCLFRSWDGKWQGLVAHLRKFHAFHIILEQPLPIPSIVCGKNF